MEKNSKNNSPNSFRGFQTSLLRQWWMKIFTKHRSQSWQIYYNKWSMMKYCPPLNRAPKPFQQTSKVLRKTLYMPLGQQMGTSWSSGMDHSEYCNSLTVETGTYHVKPAVYDHKKSGCSFCVILYCTINLSCISWWMNFFSTLFLQGNNLFSELLEQLFSHLILL